MFSDNDDDDGDEEEVKEDYKKFPKKQAPEIEIPKKMKNNKIL